MLRIDAHQHFWIYDAPRDTWMEEPIQKDFLPKDLWPILEEQAMDGCVAVQVEQSPAENAFLLRLADTHHFIKGIVGWVNLRADDIEDQLAHYRGFPLLKGFRHILQGEAERDLMLQPAFMRGIGLLTRYGFTYDVLIYPDQLAYATELARRFPHQPFVLDHLGKPDIKGYTARQASGPGSLPTWKKEMRALASCDNVCCKVSGMVTEADWTAWKPADFTPFLDEVVEAFGPKRLLFGSDWPVCTIAASYGDAARIVQDYFAHFSLEEKAGIFGGNATDIYHLI